MDRVQRMYMSLTKKSKWCVCVRVSACVYVYVCIYIYIEGNMAVIRGDIQKILPLNLRLMLQEFLHT